mmetsp:Transcript_24993/g.34776  ORF Transcript_24993/g.34776 Transcript_24993/m.34776 type:complete len:989 (+) Transcript_24993:202-3168(+)|eukprot:CAMPEP_0184487102 /NCGR_PEP_ID=MMETSP0113_2-20130426/9228_1 /TAXON_ID=91329 /ORGANISM="Norrisiella sphaerica, Strain BC52" /LENGTH=988 /DNA_ID=CAMNT_0026869281 /DNA_START=203 /DNA_END=3169 /DNA_ORIENTATION=+
MTDLDTKHDAAGDIASETSVSRQKHEVALTILPAKKENKNLSKAQVKQLYGVHVKDIEELRERYGANVIKEEKKSKLLMLLSQFTGTMAVMIEIALILTAVLEDWIDFAIIAAMLLVNASIGFHHENSAVEALEEVEGKLAANETVQVFRKVQKDGKSEVAEMDVQVEDLVVGDLAYIRAGDVIAADAVWVYGDKMYVNEACLTGETRPRKVPSDDDHDNVLKGSTLVQGEGFVRVTAVGERTVMGEANKAMQESSTVASPLQRSIEGTVNWIIAVTLVVVFFMLIIQLAVRKQNVNRVLLSATGLIVAAVPVALPLVVSVTLALGATALAAKGAIISHLSAMQDLASMDVLCSDKTGTLTTAKMTINLSKIWLNEAIKEICPSFEKEHVVELAALCSTLENAKKNEIESSVFEALKAVMKEGKARYYDSYSIEDAKGDIYLGFNPNVKRTYCTVTRKLECKAPLDGTPEHVKISKGLLTKVLCNDTKDDLGEVKWTVQDYERVAALAKAADEKFGKAGYKTLAVAADFLNSGSQIQMTMAGILPIKDPPRASTEETIRNIRAALINVKMVTGDHENIARNLAADINLGQNFLVHEDLWPASALRDERVANMDGIAQVTPKDKHEVVAVLQKQGHVVGMCGDGVNDAPALKLASVGFAVPGATQAARNAADIVLTDGEDGDNAGLKVIYDAIVISREIFQRIQAYVLYRFASTVLIVLFLSVLTFAFSADFNPLYVILLAIINDVTVTPIASDHVVGTAGPSRLNMLTVLGLSAAIGSLLSVQTILTFWGNPFGLTGGYFAEETATYLQISLTSQFMIFICRTEKPFFMTVLPHWVLIASCTLAQLMVSLWCGFGVVVSESIPVDIIVYIWLYSFAGLLVADVVKCEFYHLCDNERYPNYYYSWVFSIGRHHCLASDIKGCRGFRTGSSARPSRRGMVSRAKTGQYIQRGHVGNLTPAMQMKIRKSIHLLKAQARGSDAGEYKSKESA